MRKLVDEYMDGALEPEQRTLFEHRLASEPELADLFARIQRERALRAAALATFEASRHEAAQASQQVLESIEGSVTAGYVGRWVKRLAAVAAMLLLVAVSFVAGRSTAPADHQTASDPQVIYRVLYFADSGEPQVREFSSMDEANTFVNRQEIKQGMPQVIVAESDADLSRSGEL